MREPVTMTSSTVVSVAWTVAGAGEAVWARTLEPPANPTLSATMASVSREALP
jgi:hypothetical protein